jgi:acyl dehydratase
MKTISGIDELRASVGEELGVSEWRAITQERVDAFADATGDDYWIHVDQERAAASELGGTIAHGLFTLALGPMFTYSLVRFDGFSVTLNYGYEKVRFTAPLPTGSKVRMRSKLVDVSDVPGGAQASLLQTFEREGSEKPVCVATSILRFVS